MKSFIGSSLTLDRGFRASTIIGLSAVVDVNNINRARYILQSTLCTLFIKLREATSVSKANFSLFDWLTQKSKDNTSFLHWKCVTNLVLLYVRFICEVNFKLHALKSCTSWYFIYDHYKYASWLIIHWFDLYAIETNFFDACNFLSKGHFSFQKFHRKFSIMGLDQIYEQNNKLIKGCGGASDLLNKEKDSALIRWETCSPEFDPIIVEFEF